MWALLMLLQPSFVLIPKKPLAGLTGGQVRSGTIIYFLWSTPLLQHRCNIWVSERRNENRCLGKCDPCLSVCLRNLISSFFFWPLFWFIEPDHSAAEHFCAFWIGRLSATSPRHTLARSYCDTAAHRKSPRLADNNETKVGGRPKNADHCASVAGMTVVNYSHCVLPESPSSWRGLYTKASLQ